MKTFENIQIGNEVTFINSDNKQEIGVVTKLDNRKFTIRTAYVWKDHNGVNHISDKFFSFYKSGIKTHSHYNYGNAISFCKSPEQSLCG